MELDTYKVCGVALACSVAAFFLRGIKKEYEVPLTLAGCCLLIGAAASIAEPIMEYIRELAAMSPVTEDAFATLLRALGIAVLTRVAAGICRDLGTPSVASSIELAARLEIMLLCLPLVSAVTDGIKALLAEAGM